MSKEYMVFSQINNIDKARYYFDLEEIEHLRSEINDIPAEATGVISEWEVEPGHEALGVLKWAKVTTSSKPKARYAIYKDL